MKKLLFNDIIMIMCIIFLALLLVFSYIKTTKLISELQKYETQESQKKELLFTVRYKDNSIDVLAIEGLIKNASKIKEVSFYQEVTVVDQETSEVEEFPVLNFKR